MKEAKKGKKPCNSAYKLVFLNPKYCPEKKMNEAMLVEIPQNMYVDIYAPVTSLKKPEKNKRTYFT